MEHHDYVGRLVDLTDPSLNRFAGISLDEARKRLVGGRPDDVLSIGGSFALVAHDEEIVRMARTIDRPMRYFLAKRAEGPALVVADRIDRIAAWLREEGLGDQFHPSYTRMVPAHYVTTIRLVGCPDPRPAYERFFTPLRDSLPADTTAIGRAYIGALADEMAKWVSSLPTDAPVGVAFSGGVDSGAVFVTLYHVMRKLGLNLGRLKAFTLSFGSGDDLAQARRFLDELDLGLFLEPIEADPETIDPLEVIRIVEDYKPLDIESAAMALALGRGIRLRYPDWKHLVDGDGGDENLKDYPIDENPELTIRSVLNNPLLYQEGWGVGTFKHSETYSGGQSRSFTRTWATARANGLDGFSPFTQASVIGVAEAIPFRALTSYDVEKLYALKGDVVARGVEAVTGMKMPVFPKRRFQHGAIDSKELARRIPPREADLRRQFLALYEPS